MGCEKIGLIDPGRLGDEAPPPEEVRHDTKGCRDNYVCSNSLLELGFDLRIMLSDDLRTYLKMNDVGPDGYVLSYYERREAVTISGELRHFGATKPKGGQTQGHCHGLDLPMDSGGWFNPQQLYLPNESVCVCRVQKETSKP